ncbi:hypothetical protein [Flavobacterium macrobrachii]
MYLYSYINGIRSSRRHLCRLCR